MADRESFFCPITHEVMQDPVVDPEGNSYEREAIVNWLETHDTSPLTRTPLTISQLAPNRVLKEVIQEELAKAAATGDTQWTKPKTSSQQETAPAEPKELTEQEIKAEEVELKVTSTVSGNEVVVHASICPGAGTTRSPVDVCCVVDISGSMGTEASVKTGTGQEEKHGLSLLDIVKHAVKTVFCSLEGNDRFSLVVFSTSARVVFNLAYVKDTPQAAIFSKIDSLQPEDTTNLWDGLLKGLELLKTSVPGRVSALLLLTDGLPNVTPPRGELAMLKKYKDEHKQLSTTINTFGFGYSIDTPLLVGLATEGHGAHAFIPDASFVGTAFVNSISNIMVTMGTNVNFLIEPQQGTTIQKVHGNYQALITSWGAQVNMCSLQYEQSKDLVFRLSTPKELKEGDVVTVTLKYDAAKVGKEIVKTTSSTIQAQPTNKMQVQQLRLDLVSTINQSLSVVQLGKDPSGALGDLAQAIPPAIASDPHVIAIVADLTGQVREAFQKTPKNYFDKWGKHYLPSLARAHLLQQCNNFKDPGIQVYGGQMFQKKRDDIDNIFLQLPPPKPSVQKSRYSSSSGGGVHRAVASMSIYHNAAGPCFAGEGRVTMTSGGEKCVADLVKGDMVHTPSGPASVRCVIKTLNFKEHADLVTFPGGLRVTPYHPVRVDGKWSFPVDLHTCENMKCEAVFNFVLEESHVMVINGVECVTLGHGFEGDVVGHNYFGTEKVLRDLQQMAGWQAGLITLYTNNSRGTCMLRDDSGRVCGFVPSADQPCTSVERDM